MQERTLMKRKNHLLALAMSAILVSVAGCGGGGDDDNGNTGAAGNVDTSQLTDDALKTSIASGLTKGITSTTTTVSKVAQNSKAVNEVTGLTGRIQSRSLTVTKAAGDGFGFGDAGADDSGFDPASGLQVINDIIEKSTVTKSGNTYTIDPDESTICSDPDMTAQEIQQCTDLLEDMIVVVEVKGVSGNQVTAATTQFQYKNATFVETDFTPTTAYYQVNLAGSKTLLTDINNMAPAEDKFPVPEIMQGSLRIAADVPNENSATVTLSIPDAIRLKSTTPGDELDLSLAATDTVASLSADASTNRLDLEVGLNAVSALFPDEDAAGTFPVEFSLQALTGKFSVVDQGDDLRITGLGFDTVKLRVDNTDALSLQLDKLDAVLDASGTTAFIALNKALNFQLSSTNVRNYLDDSGSPTDTASASVTAPAGTRIAEADSNGTALKVTAGGPLNIAISESGAAPINLSVQPGQCFDPDPDLGPVGLVTCPAAQ